jgi:hypothetical protein
MLLTMPAPLPRPLRLPRLLAPKPLAAVLGAVLLAHWLLLDSPLRWGTESQTPEPTAVLFPVSLQTRNEAPAPSLPAAMATAMAPSNASTQATPLTPSTRATATATATQPKVKPPKVQKFEEKAPVALIDIAQAAPVLIAIDTPPSAPPPPEDRPSNQVAATVATFALGSASASALATEPPRQYLFPAPALVKYDVRAQVKGISLNLNGELLWQHDGKNYNARLEFTHFLLGSRMQTSKGQLGPQGLEPLRFGDKVRSEVAAHFDRAGAKVTFSANTPDVALTPGMQDQLSAVLQLSGMLAAEPQRYPAGTEIPFQAVGPRSVETWVFTVGDSEKLSMPGGDVQAIKLSRPPTGPYSNRADIWFAPSQGYLPVRIRLTEANGDVADNLWRSTQPP